MAEALKEWEMFGISDMKKEVGFMQLQEAVGRLWYRGFFHRVYIFTCVLTILDPNVFYHKENYTEEGAWPTASEKEGRCVVVEKDPFPAPCSSVVPLGLSGQSPVSSLWPPVPFLHR